MKRLVIAALIAAALTSAAPADAHRVSAAAAQNAWYARFNHECGNGFWWICRNRRIVLDCTHTDRVYPHSRWCVYRFLEEYVPSGNQRRCTYRGWLRHTTTVTLLLRGCVG